MVAERVPTSLTWTRPSPMRRRYELVSGPQSFASLRFAMPGGKRARAHIEGSAFSLMRTGVLHKKLLASETPSGQEIGRVEIDDRGKGTLEIIGGGRYSLSASQKGGWEILDHDGGVLAEMKPRRKRLHREADVMVQDRGVGDSNMLFLLTLEWYMIRLDDRDDLISNIFWSLLDGW